MSKDSKYYPQEHVGVPPFTMRTWVVESHAFGYTQDRGFELIMPSATRELRMYLEHRVLTRIFPKVNGVSIWAIGKMIAEAYRDLQRDGGLKAPSVVGGKWGLV